MDRLLESDYNSDEANMRIISLEKEQEQTKVVSREEIPQGSLNVDILQQSRPPSSPSPYGQFR